jgi:hypothetical protein
MDVHAQAVATHLQCACVAFDVGERQLQSESIDALYVVEKNRDVVIGRFGPACFVQPGLLKMKAQMQRAHPLLRALWPADEAPLGDVIDATAGLLGDTLHIAATTGARVHAIEKSAIVHCLQRRGLQMMALTPLWADAATRVTLIARDAMAHLRTLADGSVDAVLFDPMMSHPKRSAPSFEVFRHLAAHDVLTRQVLAEALRVARRRVVVKRGFGAPAPSKLETPWQRVVKGNRVVYWVWEGYSTTAGRSASSMTSTASAT